MDVLVIRTDGREERHEVSRAVLIAEIERLIGASITDTVNLRDGRVMFVDDLGYEYERVERDTTPEDVARLGFDPRVIIEHRTLRACKPENEKATALYHAICVPGTTHKIVGDVAIIRDADV